MNTQLFEPVLKLMAKYELWDIVWNEELTKIYINCNDCFGGGSDAETIEVEDINLLEQSLIKVLELTKYDASYGLILFTAIKRKIMPWDRFFNIPEMYKVDGNNLKALFQREVELNG